MSGQSKGFQFLPAGVLLAFLSLAALGFGDNIRGPLFPEILTAFQLEDFHGSWLFALSALLSAIGGLSARWIFRVWDRVRTLKVTMLMMSTALAGLGLSVSYSHFLFFSALFGFSLGLMGVCQNALVAAGSEDSHRRQVLAGLHSMYGLASLLAPALVAWLVPWTGSWRSPFLVMAIVPVLIVIWAQNKVGSELAKWREPQVAKGAVFHGVKRQQALVALAFGLYVMAEILMSTRLALYLRRTSDMDLSSSSLMVTFFFTFLLAGRLASAVVHLSWSLHRQLLASLLSSIFLCFIGLAGFPFAFALVGLSMALFYPTAVAFIAERLPHQVDSTLGVTMSTQSVLIVLMHLSAGWITEQWGVTAAMALAPLGLGISFILLVVYEFLFRRNPTGV